MKLALQFLIFSCCLFLVSRSDAQMMPPGAGGGKAGGPPKIGKVYGKVVDAKTGKPLELASVILLGSEKGSAKKVLIKGTATSANGEFSLEELPLFGQMQLNISAVGYKAYSAPVSFDVQALMKSMGGKKFDPNTTDFSSFNFDGASSMMNAVNRDLDRIKLESEGTDLQGVTVTANTPQFRLEGEKRIFNVDQNLTSQGSTAQEVMKNVPGVLVDGDGKVTIRNSSPQILVDGRQSPLQLDQIPADVIESVEVITNPSAKYDAEGGAGGILNIVLKKNRKQGYNGNVRTGADSRGGGNLGGDFNFRTGKVNVSANAMGFRNRSIATGSTTRTDYFQNPPLFTDEENHNTTIGGFAFARLGLDYFISNRTTLSVSGTKMYGNFRPGEVIDIATDTLANGAQLPLSFTRRSSSGKNEINRTGVQLGFKHLFAKPGMEWMADATYNTGRNVNENVFTTDLFSDATHAQTMGSGKQKVAGEGVNNFLTVQSDFTYPLSKTGKIDAGVKLTQRHVENVLNNYFLNPSTKMYDIIPNDASDYHNNDVVYAAYASLSGNANKDFGYQAGLRVEGSDYTGELSKTGQTFHNQYLISLFPSLAVTQKLKRDQTLQLTYRRGINRPNFFQLLPFTDFTDPLNLRQGNPGLRPEFINTAELSYTRNFGRSNYFLATAYGKRSDHLITQYVTAGTNTLTGQPALISSYINANNSTKYGIELTAQWDLRKWWTIVANVNGYNGILQTGTGTTTDNSYLSGFAKLNNTFKMMKSLSFQLSGVYQSRTNLAPDNRNAGPQDGGGGPRSGGGMGGGGGFGGGPSSSSQGYLDANWAVDAALRYAFLKNNAASLSLSVNDIFGTRKFIQHSESSLFTQDAERLMNPYMFRLNFSYRFGKLDMDLFRRKSMKGTMEGIQDASNSIGM